MSAAVLCALCMVVRTFEGGAIMRKLWESRPVRFVRELVELYFSARVSKSAAALAYFMVMTFFPFLICASAFVGVLRLDIDMVLDTLGRFLPESVVTIVVEYIQYVTGNQSVGMMIAGVFTMLVFASAAVRSLMTTMEDIYGRSDYQGVWRSVASVIFSVLLLVAVYGSVIVVLTGNWLLGWLEQFFRLGDLFADWYWLRFVLLFALVLFVILLLYRFTAPRGKPAAPVVVGAFLAAVALAGASILFSWFIGMSSRYSLVYGSLASVIILLVWLYLCGNILILGSVFNCVWYRHRKEKYRKK